MTLPNDKIIEAVRAEYLARMTSGHGHLLVDVERYVTSRIGKLLRPQMTLLAASTLGEECLTSHRTLLLAVSVEMVHNASLLHDDVIDNADTRRGQASVNNRWNPSVAVLVGDYHLASLMNLLDEVGDADVSRRINTTVMQMVEGELLQQEVLSGRTLDEETYLNIIDAKTAALFATAAALGNPIYEEFGLTYGRLFQLCDDIDDGEDTAFTQSLINRQIEHLESLRSSGRALPMFLEIEKKR